MFITRDQFATLSALACDAEVVSLDGMLVARHRVPDEDRWYTRHITLNAAGTVVLDVMTDDE